jgi:integrase
MVSVYWREKAGTKFRKNDGQVTGEYWLRYNQSGKQKWQRVGGWASVAKAKLLLERELQRNAVAKQWGLQPPSTETAQSVPDAVGRFIARKKLAGKRPATIDSYQITLNYFSDWCPRLYVEQLTGDDLLEFAASRRAEGDGPRTVANHFLTVMTFMKFCGRPKLVPITDWPKYVERPVESYTKAELDALRAAAKTEKEKLILELFIYSGFRNSEIAYMAWQDVDFEGCKVAVSEKPDWDYVPKTWECRKNRIPAKVILMLRAWKEKSKTNLLFPTREGTPDTHLLRIIQDMAERAGLTNIRVDCHKFRATFATDKSGQFRPQDVQKMLGHKSLSTTMRYLAATDQDDPDFVAKIEGAA